MVTPSLRLPTEDDARDTVRRCGFAPESTKAVEAALVALVGEIEAYVALPDTERRARRLRKLSALENAANAWRRCADVFEVARPAEAGELRKVLGPDLGRYLSSAAYGAFFWACPSAAPCPRAIGRAGRPRRARAPTRSWRSTRKCSARSSRPGTVIGWSRPSPSTARSGSRPRSRWSSSTPADTRLTGRGA